MGVVMNTRATCLLSASLLWPGAALLAQVVETTFPFRATLSGAQEPTPPDMPATPSLGVITQTTGDLLILFAQDLSSFSFTLSVRNGTAVTQADLHCGRPGQNGPVVVFLSALNTSGANVNGVLAQSTLTNQDIQPTAEGCEALIGRPVRNIASLAGAALDGLIYVNVHTVANPAGEIRGQLISSEGEGAEATSTSVVTAPPLHTIRN
jgi:CHRD domain